MIRKEENQHIMIILISLIKVITYWYKTLKEKEKVQRFKDTWHKNVIIMKSSWNHHFINYFSLKMKLQIHFHLSSNLHDANYESFASYACQKSWTISSIKQ